MFWFFIFFSSINYSTPVKEHSRYIMVFSRSPSSLVIRMRDAENICFTFHSEEKTGKNDFSMNFFIRFSTNSFCIGLKAQSEHPRN